MVSAQELLMLVLLLAQLVGESESLSPFLSV